MNIADLLQGLPQQSQGLPQPPKKQPFGMLRSQMGLPLEEQAAELSQMPATVGQEAGIPLAQAESPVEAMSAKSPEAAAVESDIEAKAAEEKNPLLEGLAGFAKGSKPTEAPQQAQMQALNVGQPQDTMVDIRAKILEGLMNRGQ